MLARSRPLVYSRQESFGLSVYVSERDDNFLIDDQVARIVQKFTARWKKVEIKEAHVVRSLAELGILESKDEKGVLVPQIAYSGVHLIGKITDIPVVQHPLVVNCFSTSWCPLKCVYCHADDLMKDYRASETLEGVERVVETASKIPALAYVITGGDPLTKPDRALALAERLSDKAGVVIDTSGVGSVEDALQMVKSRPMHMRISIDSMDPRINRVTRPINPAMRPTLDEKNMHSLGYAERMVDRIAPWATGVSVQTVISSKNDKYDHLIQLRDWLISRGVKNWILHVAINAGAATRFAIRTDREKQKLEASAGKEILATRKATKILPDLQNASRSIKRLIENTQSGNYDIDIRCTNANDAPNSVFLLDSEGDLFTQGRGKDRGRKVSLLPFGSALRDLNALWTYVNPIDHAQRYINFLPAVHGTPIGIRFDERLDLGENLIVVGF